MKRPLITNLKDVLANKDILKMIQSDSSPFGSVLVVVTRDDHNVYHAEPKAGDDLAEGEKTLLANLVNDQVPELRKDPANKMPPDNTRLAVVKVAEGIDHGIKKKVATTFAVKEEPSTARTFLIVPPDPGNPGGPPRFLGLDENAAAPIPAAPEE